MTHPRQAMVDELHRRNDAAATAASSIPRWDSRIAASCSQPDCQAKRHDETYDAWACEPQRGDAGPPARVFARRRAGARCARARRRRSSCRPRSSQGRPHCRLPLQSSLALVTERRRLSSRISSTASVQPFSRLRGAIRSVVGRSFLSLVHRSESDARSGVRVVPSGSIVVSTVSCNLIREERAWASTMRSI